MFTECGEGEVGKKGVLSKINGIPLVFGSIFLNKHYHQNEDNQQQHTDEKPELLNTC